MASAMTMTRKDVESEIADIRDAIHEQKKVIKKNVGRQLIIEAAQAEMRALNTRLSVLESQL